MAVVVNEFEVVPAAPASEPTPTPVPAVSTGTGGRLSPAAKADVERALRARAERRQRLEVY